MAQQHEDKLQEGGFQWLRQINLVQDCVYKRASLLAVFNLQVLFPENYL